MKKIFILASALLLSIGAFSQGQMPALPNDPEVKTGKLENGMTYYIRHNALPEGRAEFYLATNAGAIQEAPDQDGLAHFLEHMCFNGLKNLPGKQMLEYLQHVGAEFGRNINASTGIEHTQYMLNNMPVTREGIPDTCLLVMHDYSHFVLNDPVEIDAERGVILEEKRTRNNASWRMFEASAPYLYGPSSKYSTCTVIGSADNLKNFKPESLKNFYQTWYRPDLQALIIVGDIDVEQVYNKVVKLFSDIPAPASPTEKVMPDVEMNDEPVVGILTDKENTSTSVEFYWKLGEPMPKEYNNTALGYGTKLLKRIISGVMTERLDDIAAKQDAPFLNAGLFIGSLCEKCEAVIGSADCENAKVEQAATALLTEIEKLRRFGITDDEMKRVTDDFLKNLKNKVEAETTRKNPEFIYPIMNNFFDNQPYMTPQTELQVATALCSQINATAVNQTLGQLLTGEHLTIIYTGVDQEGNVHPTKESLLAIVDKVKNADIQANASEQINKDFMAGKTLKGAAVKKEGAAEYEGGIEWTLKNGLKVVVLPTQYKKDQVGFDLVRKGGTSLIPDADIDSFDSNVMQMFNANSGISSFSSTTVTKMLSGKTVSVNPYMRGITSGVSGSCAPEDIETALQLLNLCFTDPRFDTEEWNVGINQLKTYIPNMLTTPNYVLNQHLYKGLFAPNNRVKMISMETLEKASLATYEKYYRQLFSGVNGATLYVVGNIDPAALKPLVEKYCSSLPKGKASAWNAAAMPEYASGENIDVFKTAMTTPKATVLQFYSNKIAYTLQKQVNLDAANFILDMIYVETLREEEGGTYGASSSMDITYQPREEATIQVYFDTNVDQQESLRALAIKGLKNLAENGPTEEQLTRARENAKKNVPEKRITNSYWMNAMKYNRGRGGDYDKEYEAAVEGISAEGIKAVLQEIISSGNFAECVMLPQE